MAEWFAKWFDSPYYHVLYGHRNQLEADHLIKLLITQIQLEPSALVTDLGCGTGRHCLALHRHGMNVTGIDLSENSIETARNLSPKEIKYHVADMRQPLPVNDQQAIFSLFTSFGYFDQEEENLHVLKNIHHALAPGGWLVLDYLNAHTLINMPREEHVLTREHITFRILKQADEKKISKEIFFTDEGKDYRYAEKVSLFTLAQFSDLLSKSGFQIINTFGNYMLHPYTPHSSPRLILIARKQ